MGDAAILTEDELYAISDFTQPSRQLEELLARGFWRARLGRSGRVIVERAHYLAVCAGALPPAADPAHNPPSSKLLPFSALKVKP